LQAAAKVGEARRRHDVAVTTCKELRKQLAEAHASLSSQIDQSVEDLQPLAKAGTAAGELQFDDSAFDFVGFDNAFTEADPPKEVSAAPKPKQQEVPAQFTQLSDSDDDEKFDFAPVESKFTPAVAKSPAPAPIEQEKSAPSADAISDSFADFDAAWEAPQPVSTANTSVASTPSQPAPPSPQPEVPASVDKVPTPPAPTSNTMDEWGGDFDAFGSERRQPPPLPSNATTGFQDTTWAASDGFGDDFGLNSGVPAPAPANSSDWSDFGEPAW
jgi:hypothetical protein